VKPCLSAPLRLVHVVQTVNRGGAEAVVRLLSRRLADRGVAVAIVSIYDPNLTPAERAAFGVSVREVGRRGRLDVGAFPRLVRILRELRPDVVHAHVHAGKYLGRAAALLARVPAVVFTEHGDDRDDPLRRAINRVLDARTDRFIVFTPAQVEPFVAKGVPRGRVRVVPNGAEAHAPVDRATARADLALAPEETAIVMPARLTDAEKGQSRVLRAVAALRDRRPDLRVLFAGEGPDRATLKALASELGLADVVRFLGYRDDVPRLLRAADLYAIASVAERMPLALGEAMLAGVPVASTPWDGVAHFVEDGRTGVVATDLGAPAFAEAILRGLDAERVARAEAARAFARELFDVERCVDRHIALYEELRRT